MSPGDRVVVVGGPWPERRGCHGVVVTGPQIYPFHSIPKHEVVILLDDDPLYLPFSADVPFAGCPHPDTWSCVIGRRDLEPEPRVYLQVHASEATP